MLCDFTLQNYKFKNKQGQKALNKNIIVLNKIQNETKDSIHNSSIPDIIIESSIIHNTITNKTMKERKKEEIDDINLILRQKALDDGFELIKKCKEGHLFALNQVKY